MSKHRGGSGWEDSEDQPVTWVPVVREALRKVLNEWPALFRAVLLIFAVSPALIVLGMYFASR